MQTGGIGPLGFGRAMQSQVKSTASKAIAQSNEVSRKFLEAHRSAMEQQKARAEERLERAKQLLAMLKRMGFPPDVIARRAAELAREVGAAAQEFASATGSRGGADMAFEGDGNIAGPSPSSGSEAQGSEDEPTVTFAERAYRETMDEQREAGMSPADRRTLSEFEAVAQEIKALIEKAKHRMRQEGNEADITIREQPASVTDHKNANAATSGGGVGTVI